ncbi:MAG: aminotransferase class I/II-fold pyridoxal phosphate-dependent enzyme [Sulfuricellaceae bacterium]|nr:aminotransferase class I/II-fold pyridoxal phosphate-dependent enzyme [Sulfuricellaceae bacterium]
MDTKNSALATRCIHAGEMQDANGSPHTPIYTTTTFKFDSTADLLDVVEGRKPGSLYTRYGLNPTIRALEDKLASLEGAEAAWAFCSGMAAEVALFLTHGRKGIICIGEAYGGSMELLASQLPELGIPTYFVLANELKGLNTYLEQGAGLVFFETPTNPTMEVLDIAAISNTAHEYGALVAVDNTFASPVNQNPLELGADFVVHSATKYLGGHSDLTAGALMGSTHLLATVWPWRKNLGTTISPEIASQLMRSIRSLVVRVERQNATAKTVAEAMLKHPMVAGVRYPGLPGFSGHGVAKAQMKGFGGMLTLEIKGNYEDAVRVVDRLKLFAIAPSLGGVESLATMPVTTTHHGLSPVERAMHGITDSMIRLSIGLEDAADLIADLEQALG